LERLLAEARGAGEVVEEGRFRLDLARAQEKIKSFQLADPHMYALELVRAGVATGAPQVDIRMDSDDLVLTCAGTPFGREELEHLFDHLFAADAHLARLRHLALGLDTALALKPRWLTVESGDGAQGLRLRVEGLGALTLEELGPGQAPQGTRVHLRERMSWKVVREALFVRNPEEPLLEAGCRFASVPVTLNGRDLRAALTPDAVARCAFQTGQVRGALALPAEAGLGCHLWLCLAGVVVSEAELHEDLLAQAGAVGFVEHPALRRNASHSDVIKDGTYQTCLRAARNALPQLMRTWLTEELSRLGPGAGPAERSGWRRRVQLAARLLLRPDSAPEGDAGLTALLEVPELLPAAVGGRRLTLGEVWSHRRRAGCCRVARRAYELAPGELPEGWLVVCLEGEGAWQREALEACLGPLSHVDEELQERERIASNRRSREAGRGPARLPKGDWLVRVPLEDEALPLSGEAGLLAVPLEAHACCVSFRREGIPLAQELPQPGAVAYAELESPAFTPTPAWDGLLQDAAYQAALARLEAAAPELLAALAGHFPVLPPPEPTARLPRWTAQGPRAPRDPLAARLRFGLGPEASLVRAHVDRLLERWTPAPEAVPDWLAGWPLFHALGGRAFCLADLRADPRPAWACVEAQPWSDTDEDAHILNLSGLERRLLRSWLGPGRLADGQAALAASRAARALEAERRRKREENVAAAERRAQAPRLPPGEVTVALDLPAQVAPGQVGAAISGKAEGRLTCLLFGLPVCTLEFPAPVPVRAVAELGGMGDVSANDLFDAVQGPGVERLLGAVRERLPALLEALAVREDVPLELRQKVFRVRLARAKELAEVPPALRQARLLPSVGHGLLDLDGLAALVGAGQGRPLVRFTSREASRQRDPLPILRVPSRLANLVARLLGGEARDHSQALEGELVALAFLDQAPRPARLEVATALCVPLAGEGLTGELGLPLEPAAGPASLVTLLLGGRLVGERQVDLLQLPLCGVVSSEAFQPRADFQDVLADGAWAAAEAVLRRAAEQLVLAAVEALHGGACGPGATQAVRLVLRDGLRGRFTGKAGELAGAGLAPWESALAGARVFEGLSGEVWSARELAQAVSRDGSLWVVDALSGRPARGRIMLSGAQPRLRATLEALFGPGALRDGAEQLRLDELAQQRRLEAPTAESLPALRWLRRTALEQDGALRVRGQVGLSAEGPASRGGIEARLIVEGRLLCTHTFPHPLTGLAELALGGLAVDAGWERPAEPAQLAALESLLHAALWSVVGRLAEETTARGEATPEERGNLIAALEAHLAGLTAELEPIQAGAVGQALLAAPVFPALEGWPLSAQEAVAEAAAGRLAVLSAAVRGQAPLQGGAPLGPWARVIRAGEAELAVLRRLLGRRLVLADKAWRARARFEDPGLLGQLRARLGRVGRRVLPALRARQLEKYLTALRLERGDGARLIEAGGGGLDPAHPLWKAAQGALQAGRAPDPWPYLLAAVVSALVPDRVSVEDALALLASLAGGEANGDAEGED
ncbi:MAG TPA: hypothetical protein P5076_18100, partial [Myxococcota bacterium]|nr:hypothetical protein [Myxococcota bacterium]